VTCCAAAEAHLFGVEQARDHEMCWWAWPDDEVEHKKLELVMKLSEYMGNDPEKVLLPADSVLV
jgi:hypothetical protein